MNQFPVVVGEAGGPTHRPADRRRDRFGREAEHEHVFGECRAHRRRDRRRIGVLGQPVDGPVDVGERRIGLQEEVPREVEVGDLSVDDLQIGDDQLAAGNLELTMHPVPPIG